jgi:hypothetical protein
MLTAQSRQPSGSFGESEAVDERFDRHRIDFFGGE